VVLFSLFFSDRLASDSGAGTEVLQGTPLRMPSNPDYKAFRKIISQLPDVDAPYVFCLPDNIERSLQRTSSAQLIRQLRVLSSSDAEAAKYDREKWRAQLGPVMELWQQLVSSSPGVISKRAGRDASGPSSVASKKNVDPVEDFVMMEYELAGEICGIIDLSLSGLKKVSCCKTLLFQFLIVVRLFQNLFRYFSGLVY
jgi:dynein heavy chain 2, cytosolic